MGGLCRGIQASAFIFARLNESGRLRCTAAPFPPPNNGGDYASPGNAAGLPAACPANIPGAGNVTGEMAHPGGDMKHSELTVRDAAGKPVASYSVEWGRNGGYWQGQVKNAAGRTVGQTSPISVFPGTNGAPPRASVTVEFTPSETQDLKTKAEPAETEMKRRGHGTGPLATTYGRTSTAMDKSADPCKDMPGARHHEIPAELMDNHANFWTRLDIASITG